MNDSQHRNIALWLLMICAAIFAMIVLGGVTRLTGSGLSMIQWAPITGILPPLNVEQWTAVFKLYQASPEFLKINPGLDLAGFKSIFWFEYFHRLLGRAIGVLFFLPMVYFWWRYPLSLSLKLKLLGIFMLGAAQGLLGWYMVKSGLVNDPHVSQYRLVAHLALALILYMAIFWLASGYFIRHWTHRYTVSRRLTMMSVILLVLVFMTILAGGFVAGTKAGFAFNTFPMMNGHLIPEAYSAASPWWLNWFENIAAVQFNHRVLASISLFIAMVVSLMAAKALFVPAIKRMYALVLVLIIAQYSLGVLTLINVVPVHLGALHQAMAVVVLTAGLWLVRVLVKMRH